MIDINKNERAVEIGLSDNISADTDHGGLGFQL